jgi:hypothetical protein
MALGKKTGGRIAGTPNKTTAHRQVAAAQSGMMPVEFMLHVMRGEFDKIGMTQDDITPPLRMTAAKDVAPYLHPRLHAIEHKQREADDTSPSFTWLPPT